MRAPFMKSAAVAVVLALSTLAHAADEVDAPGVAGRVSLMQGDVTLESVEGGRGAAMLNWPVTGGDILSTARGARTEVRVGSTAVRLDGDSSMEVVRLDEDTVRLRLFYGSVNVRVMNRELLDGFEVSTPYGSVRMTQPGRIRVDAERAPETTSLNVFEGVAVLSVPGSSLTVREGRSAESRSGDILTGAAVRDGFDDWAYLRDLRDDRSQAARYVPREMTGYEELDQYGSWSQSSEYGPLWMPRAIPVGWVPYRDGRWTWVAPWGWTWVDNAPWGYAPSHYGRWVMVNGRWCWAPGRVSARPVWAPALVGWVGGSNWSLSFNSGGSRYMPAQGWYPLSPHDAFVPHYRARRAHLNRINFDVRPPRVRPAGQRPNGLTVVPQENFGIRNVIEVANLPKASVPVAALPGARVAPPPVPPRRRAERDDRERAYEDNPSRGYVRGAGPLVVNPQPQPQAARDWRDDPRRGRRDGEGDDDRRGRGMRMPQTALVQRPADPAPVMVQRPADPAPMAAQPAQPPAPVEALRNFGRRGAGDDRADGGPRRDREDRFDGAPRREREDRDGPRRQREQVAPPQAAPMPFAVRSAPEQPVRREREQPMPAPVMQAPAPVAALAPPPQAVRQAPPPAPPAAAPERSEHEPVRGRRGPGKADDERVER